MRDDRLRAASAERRAKGFASMVRHELRPVKDALGPFPDAAMLGVDGTFSRATASSNPLPSSREPRANLIRAETWREPATMQRWPGFDRITAAVSLARLRRDQCSHAEGRDLLAPVYGWVGGLIGEGSAQ